MTELDLPGDIRDAFSHMAIIGLAAIMEAQGVHDPAIRWSGGMDPHPQMRTTADWEAVAMAVRDHANAHTQPGAWLQTRSAINQRPTAAFSPRVKTMSVDEFSQLVSARRGGIDALTADVSGNLDRRMIGALGMPAYWSHNYKGEPLQDDGATRWEMKTRNRGEELVGNRLALLADVVAKRSEDQVMTGLDGSKVVDELGKGHLDSRTPTGLRPPGPVDSARAWCALWAISQFPIRFQLNNIALTTGYVGDRGDGYFYLPAFREYTSMARLRSVLGSEQLRALATVASRSPVSTRPHVKPGDVTRSTDWLLTRHVEALVTFKMAKTDNLSAPEKWAGTGVVTPLRSDKSLGFDVQGSR